MTQVILSADVVAKLQDAWGPVEICDETGKVVGVFRPKVDPSFYDGIECPVSEEELDRRSKTGGGRALADILADLEKLG